MGNGTKLKRVLGFGAACGAAMGLVVSGHGRAPSKTGDPDGGEAGFPAPFKSGTYSA